MHVAGTGRKASGWRLLGSSAAPAMGEVATAQPPDATAAGAQPAAASPTEQAQNAGPASVGRDLSWTTRRAALSARPRWAPSGLCVYDDIGHVGLPLTNVVLETARERRASPWCCRGQVSVGSARMRVSAACQSVCHGQRAGRCSVSRRLWLVRRPGIASSPRRLVRARRAVLSGSLISSV